MLKGESPKKEKKKTDAPKREKKKEIKEEDILEPKDLFHVFREKYALPVSLTCEYVNKHMHEFDVDEGMYMARYLRNRRDFELYYALAQKEKKKE